MPDGEENLAWRAAVAYADAARQAGRPVDRRIRVRLGKRTPPGAGLGGGSVDAAAVLLALEEETGAVGADALFGLAATLGSDVPFFLLPSGAAIGRGRGELLESLDGVPPYDVVLVLPGTRHDTGRVFRHVTPGAPHGGLEEAVTALRSGDPARLRAALHNALLPAALAAYPGFAALVAEVTERLGRPPALSGTGSTLFDLPEPAAVEDVLARLDGVPGRVLHVRAGASGTGLD